MKQRISLSIGGIIALTAVVVLFASFFIHPKKDPVVGSVVMGNEYNYFNASSTAGLTCVKSLPGTLGSVVISSSTLQQFTLTDATSTIDAASTTIAQFFAFPPAGTYQYDIAFTRGLCIRSASGFGGMYTVTWR